MNSFVPLRSFGRQIALHLCDWNETSRAYRKVNSEELDGCVERYTLSFINSIRSSFERSILECSAFHAALESEDVKTYAAELGECTDEKRFRALMARILLCCCMEIPNEICGEENLYDTAYNLLNCYVSGLLRRLTETFERDHLKASRTFLLEQSPEIALVEGNAAHYAACFEEPLHLEHYKVYDNAEASLKDCYVSPTYSLAGQYFNWNSLPLEDLLEVFLSGTVPPELPADKSVYKERMTRIAQRGTALILGPHGSGRTSILYKLAHDLTHGAYCTGRRFWGLELTSLADEDISGPVDLMDTVLEHLNCSIRDLENSILCLDGMDDLLLLLEQESLTDEYVQHLAKDVAAIPGCKCIITACSGSISGRDNEHFWAVELRKFSPKAYHELIGKYAAVHPTAKKHLLRPTPNTPTLWPDQLYASLALDISMTEGMDFWSARISKVEFFWQHIGNDRNLSRLAAETLAVSMMEQQRLESCSKEAACTYAWCEEEDERFFRDAYGLTFLEGGGSFAARFRSSDAIDYLAARRIEKEAETHLRIDTEDVSILKSWCALFARCQLSDKFLSYYKIFLSRPKEKSDAPFRIINASLKGTKLLELLPGNIVGTGYYLKNLSGLCKAYRTIGYRNQIEISDLVRWFAIAKSLGAQIDHFSLLHMDFLDDIQHLSFEKLKIVNCAFINCKVSFCRLREVIENTQFTNVVFTNCDLSKVHFRNCQFLNCRFEHCDLTEVQFAGNAMKHTSFADCDLNHANLRYLRLSGCTFENSRLRLCEFRDIDSCVFRQTDISAANFSGLDLRNTDLEDLYMSGVYGANFWNRASSPNISFKGCSILLHQIKNIYQFLEDIRDVKVFDDNSPDQAADPLMVSCEYRFCKGEEIPQDELKQFAERFWPDGIVVET